MIETPAAPSPPPERTAPPEEPLCSWIHLSDIHIGHGGVSYGWDQELVLDALARDVDRLHREHHAPAPRFLFVTGDVAFSGKPAQYEKAKAWLARLAKIVGLGIDRVLIVPGNHDVDRDADKDRNTKRLIRALRGGDEDLDDAMNHDGDRAMLAARMAAYLAFAKEIGAPSDLSWSRAEAASGSGVALRVVGLNTALLAADDRDQGRLRLGNAQVALLTDARDDELTIVLSHHPFEEKWLSDERDARAWTERRADIHLCGHVHSAEAVHRRTGAGTGIVTVVAGAAHGDRQPAGVPTAHGYSWAAVVRTPDDRAVLRVWPRRWSPRMDFRLDVDHVPEGKLFAEHALTRLRLPARGGGQ